MALLQLLVRVLRKLKLIKDCIHGVDIQPAAIQISKLRFFLSLVIEQRDATRIRPLPNLETEFVCANTLLGLPRPVGWELFQHQIEPRARALLDTRSRYFFAQTKEEKDDCKAEHHRLRRELSEWNQRQEILARKQYETLWEKWDLYVPFIERSYKLLRPGGISTLIVSDAFCHSKYAQKPQNCFLCYARIPRLDFCAEVKIFDAAVHSLIYFFQEADGTHWQPERRVHHETFGNVIPLPSDDQAKLTYRAFFPGEGAQAQFSTSVLPIGQICYVSYGCRPNSDEKKAKGLFVAADLLSDRKDAWHPKPYIEAKEADRWIINPSNWLEWGTERSPSMLARPTFEELFEVPEKLMAARVAGGENRAYYDGKHVFHNHTLISFVPWHALHGVRNNSLKKSARYRGEKPPRLDFPKRGFQPASASPAPGVSASHRKPSATSALQWPEGRAPVPSAPSPR